MMRLMLGFAILTVVGCRQSTDSKSIEDLKPDTDNPSSGDEDADGYLPTDGDCNDNDPNIHPGAAELCDGIDNNCDGQIDEGLISTWYQDGDGDGYGDVTITASGCTQPPGFIADATDCVDTDATIHPGAEETCTDTTDRNCDGSIGYVDADADGFAACEECNDGDAAINPGAQEICDPNDVDEDCDNQSDDADPSVDPSTQSLHYTDGDGDGYGDASTGVLSCDGNGAIYTGDCNDADPAYNPGAPETDCTDPNDYNCDGFVGYSDNDGDGFAACQECNDGDAAISPNGTEVCNLVDDNCNGTIDEFPTDGSTYYADVDGDGYGDDNSTITACGATPGYTTTNGDCDDGAAGTNPGATEYCDGIDNNCDGQIDENGANPNTYYTDADNDGYGDPNAPVQACSAPTGAVADATDCNDNDSTINPAGTEICNGVDDDCNGTIDDNAIDGNTWYEDTDHDGYGNDAVTSTDCNQPAGYSPFGGDCNDSDPAYNPGAVELDCNDPNDYNCDGSSGYIDLDGDGYAACEECDDTNANNYPGALEFCDGVDNNCDGQVDEDAIDASTWYLDADSDGYGNPNAPLQSCQYVTGYLTDNTDCNDGVSSVHPNASEYCNGVDDNCNGQTDESAVDVQTWYIDTDGDGFGDPNGMVQACTQPNGYSNIDGDCNDTDAAYNPAAIEADCTDPNDYNCDGTVIYADADNDGYAACIECDDSNAAVHPGATETCNSTDDDCDGQIDENAVDAITYYADADSDGYGSSTTSTQSCSQPNGYVTTNTDCNDNVATTHPNATEYCDNADNDCNGLIDDGATDALTWFHDVDSDGYGNAADTTLSCSQPAGYVATSTDCNDSVAAINPAATELCNGYDDNCDGITDTDATDRTTWYVDTDGDGYGNANTSTLSCSQPNGYVANSTDCNDSVTAVHPNATEACNGYDDDCDGQTDEAGSTGEITWYQDADTDGYGGSATQSACTQPSGYVATSTDCNDAATTIHPGASEVCNGLDDNCNSLIDDGATGLGNWYLDSDGDGYGNTNIVSQSCSQPSGYVAGGGDCNDSVAAVNPGATETCNSIDDDCDGQIDEAGSGGTTWYRDADSDGYGNASTSQIACTQPTGYVANSTDCNDSAAAISPAATEACNGYDDDCDGNIDEAGATGSTTWYRDADADGYAGSTTLSACTQPSGYLATSTDCNDSVAAINPGATEACNGYDDDCDGQVDEAGATGATTWYRDADSDGYGGSTTQSACTQPTGYVATSTDCNDAVSSIHPNAAETCNSIDDNCNGIVDDNATNATTWYRDADGDGYGTSTSTSTSCSQPSGYVANSTDCNDGVSTINPAATETCNSIDDDCDGLVDEAGATGGTTWYLDTDGDGYGTSTSTVVACTRPTGYAATSTDCNDAVSSINPGATDICDGIDNNCSGYADDAGLCPCTVLYNGTKPYMFCTSAQSWTTAATNCSYYGYNLLTVNSSAENIWAVDNAYRYYYGKWWTGGNDRAREGTWTWYSGQSWSYSNWHTGEPNNSGDEDCMQFGRFLDYTWNDEPCASPFRYICEGP